MEDTREFFIDDYWQTEITLFNTSTKPLLFQKKTPGNSEVVSAMINLVQNLL